MATIIIAFINFSIYIASFRCKLHCPCRITHGQQRFCQVLWMYCPAISKFQTASPTSVMLSEMRSAYAWRRRAPRPFFGPPDGRGASSAHALRVVQDARSSCLELFESRLDYNRRTLIDHFEQFDHVLVTHSHAAVTRRRADFVLVFGAMNVHEAVARIRIVLIQSVEPQNT